MSIKIETAQKYYCLEPEKLIKLAEQLGFKLINKFNEVDEYFTDINGNFIKNRTCLRIRKNNSKKMEITFKGKSDSILGQYCKLENNINVDENEYNNYISLFSSLGYYSYVEVIKDRIVYKLDNNKHSYGIMLDNLNMIGGFVEFEVSSIQCNINKAELTKELNKLISKFEEIKLIEENNTYRDIVAEYEMKKYNIKKSTNIYINIDCEMLEYEKDFFKKYKEKISKVCHSNIRWGEYKMNSQLSNKIEDLVDEYLDNLIFDNNELLITMQLLKKIKYKKYFVTKVNKKFFIQFFKKINLDIENIIFIKTDNYSKIFKENNINPQKSIILNEKSINKINQNLLIILNSEEGVK